MCICYRCSVLRVDSWHLRCISNWFMKALYRSLCYFFCLVFFLFSFPFWSTGWSISILVTPPNGSTPAFSYYSVQGGKLLLIIIFLYLTLIFFFSLPSVSSTLEGPLIAYAPPVLWPGNLVSIQRASRESWAKWVVSTWIISQWRNSPSCSFYI